MVSKGSLRISAVNVGLVVKSSKENRQRFNLFPDFLLDLGGGLQVLTWTKLASNLKNGKCRQRGQDVAEFCEFGIQ